MKKYRSVIAYIALSAVVILLFVLYVATAESGLGVGGLRPALLYIPRPYAFILHAITAAILGVVIVIRARLCAGFSTVMLKIALPLFCAAVEVGVSCLLYSHFVDSYPQLWTLAAADVASIFVGMAKRRS